MLRSAFIFLLLLTLPLRANLGESITDCIKRYGKPVGYTEANGKLPFGTLLFVAGGYGLIVFLLNNSEVGARVSKADKSAFTEAEMKTIMGADGVPAWTVVASPDPTCLTWSRADKATALYDKQKHVLIFTSANMSTALHAPPPAAPVAPAASARPTGTFVPAAPTTWTAPGTPVPAEPAK